MISIILILLFRVVQNLLNKQCSNGITNNVMFLKFLSIRQFASAALALVLILFTAELTTVARPDPLTLAFALLMAVALAVNTFSGLWALKSGTMVLSSLFGMAGLFIPCIAGVFLFDEPISLVQAAGLVIFIAAACQLIGCSREIYQNFSAKTLVLLLVSMLSNGAVMLAQKMFSFYVPEGNAGVFNFYGFFLSAVLSLVGFLVFWSKAVHQAEAVDVHIPPKVVLYGLALSAAVFVISQASTVAAATIPSVILFPVSDGGGMIICALVSALVYGEKLTKKSVIGLILGFLSLIIINFG